MNKGSREGLPPQSTVYVAALLILCLEFAAPLSLFARQLTTPMPNSNMPALLQQFDGKNPPEIATVLSRWAASDKAGDQECLRSALGSEELLLRLNSADEHARLRPDQLRVSSVLAALATNQSAPARATIDFLAGNAAFLADLGRQDLLLEAVRRVRPATPAMIHFFEEQTRPDAANLYLAMDCLVDNGSEPAAALIEKILGDRHQEPENVQGWMRDSILAHRNDGPLLKACDNLLRGPALSQPLKQSLVEALFDYKPEEWYNPDSKPPRPPDRSQASPAARATLRNIAEWVSRQPWLPPGLRAKVREQISHLK